MLRTTPPSARTAAPLMAMDCMLATKATTVAISSGVSKRFNNDVGRADVKNCRSTSAVERFCSLAMFSTNLLAPSEAVGPTRMELTVTPVPATDSSMLRGFAGDENVADPIFLEHTGKISASQPHTVQHVNLEEAQPFGVGNFQEWLYIENTQIIDENVCCGSLLEEALNAGGGTKVGGYTAQLGAGYMLLNGFESSVYAGLRAAIYDYRCTFRGEGGGNRQADASGRAGHDGRLSLQSEVHFFSL